jgi:hypothetical protein
VGEGYRRRWIIERCFGWMNNYRRLVVRYDRYLHIYRAFCLIAFIIWRFMTNPLALFARKAPGVACLWGINR